MDNRETTEEIMSGKVDGIGIPAPRSPMDGMRILCSSVQFCWAATDDGFGYEIQYSQAEDFSDPVSAVFQNLPATNAHAWLPEEPLQPGKWHWRMRTMTMDGIFGNWSAPHSFVAIASRKKARQELTISSTHPLFIFHTFGGEHLAEQWRNLPERLKPHTVLRIERARTEELVSLCERAQTSGIPILVQLAGPHDSYDGNYARIPLADVEHIFQRFPTVKGVQIVEQSCQGGLRQSRVLKYLIAMLRLVASYGKIAAWADGRWHGNNIWIDAELHEGLYRAMQECGNSLIPIWKMNCALMPYAVQGPIFGLWTGGATANWGVEPEVSYWYEAGFHELDVQHGFKEGDNRPFPAPFWGQMALMGLSAGAAVYSFEPQDALWQAQGELSEAGKRVILPLLTRIIDWRLVPSREEVKSSIRIAYVAGKADTPWRMDGGPLAIIYQGTYGFDHPFQMIPGTGRYGWIPVLSPYANNKELEDFSALLSADSFRTASDVRVFFDSEYPSESEGSAWSARAGSLWVVTNHHENRDLRESFSIPLGGHISRVEGVLEVNGYLVISQKEDRPVRIHANGRSDRTMSVSFSARGGAAPTVEAAPASALKNARYDRSTKTFSCTLEFSRGAVDLIVTAEVSS